MPASNTVVRQILDILAQYIPSVTDRMALTTEIYQKVVPNNGSVAITLRMLKDQAELDFSRHQQK